MKNVEKELKIISILINHDFAILDNVQCDVIYHYDRKLTVKENDEILLGAAIIEKFYDLRAPKYDNDKQYVFGPILEDILNPIIAWKVEEECLEDEVRYEKVQ